MVDRPMTEDMHLVARSDAGLDHVSLVRVLVSCHVSPEDQSCIP